MVTLKLVLVILTALSSFLGSASGEKIINCYWGTWSHYRTGDGAFKAEHIDPNLCTHLSYSFLGIDANGEVRVLDDWLDLPSGLNNIAKAVSLKQVNPKLKVILVIGGWNEGSAKYSQMAADPVKRKTFVKSVLKFMQEHKFDGLDLDWEYPSRRDGAPKDKENFVVLLKEIYEALNAYNYLFGIAVGASAETADISYQLPEISNYLHFINVMTYDFATWDGGVFGHNAPLRGQGVNNVETSMKFWLSKGVPANKLVLGLPFYGHTFKLANAKQNGVGSSTNGPGAVGPYTQQPGYLGYNEICTMKDYSYRWAEKESVPVLQKSNELITYDDAKSIALKVDLANSLNLAGVMVWSIETDDFRGMCGTKNILLKTINDKMGKPQDMSPGINDRFFVEATAAPELSPYNQPTRTDISKDCSVDGLFPHKSDCTKFIHCAGGVAYEKTCSSGLYFDSSTTTCNWPELVKCH